MTLVMTHSPPHETANYGTAFAIGIILKFTFILNSSFLGLAKRFHGLVSLCRP
jgi:hypothetical protein